jgi:hypothetical protein
MNQLPFDTYRKLIDIPPRTPPMPPPYRYLALGVIALVCAVGVALGLAVVFVTLRGGVNPLLPLLFSGWWGLVVVYAVAISVKLAKGEIE